MKQSYLVLILKGLVMIWTSMDEELDKNFEFRNFNASFLLCTIVNFPSLIVTARTGEVFYFLTNQRTTVKIWTNQKLSLTSLDQF